MKDRDWWAGDVTADDATLLVWADYLEETADPRAADVRELPGALRCVEGARERLRAGHVEPNCLRVYKNGTWFWSVFVPLPSHPRAALATLGFIAPTDMSAYAQRGGENPPLGRILVRFDHLNYLAIAVGRRLALRWSSFTGAQKPRVATHIEFEGPPY